MGADTVSDPSAEDSGCSWEGEHESETPSLDPSRSGFATGSYWYSRDPPTDQELLESPHHAK